MPRGPQSCDDAAVALATGRRWERRGLLQTHGCEWGAPPQPQGDPCAGPEHAAVPDSEQWRSVRGRRVCGRGLLGRSTSGPRGRAEHAGRAGVRGASPSPAGSRPAHRRRARAPFSRARPRCGRGDGCTSFGDVLLLGGPRCRAAFPLVPAPGRSASRTPRRPVAEPPGGVSEKERREQRTGTRGWSVRGRGDGSPWPWPSEEGEPSRVAFSGRPAGTPATRRSLVPAPLQAPRPPHGPDRSPRGGAAGPADKKTASATEGGQAN